MDLEPNPRFFTAPADTARAMHAAEMRGQNMQDLPEQIWAWQYMTGSLIHGKWSPYPDEVNDPPCSLSYTRTDLCITEAECQRRIDAAVHKLINALMWIDNRCPSGLALCGRDHPNQTHANAMYDAGECARAAIRARGQK